MQQHLSLEIFLRYNGLKFDNDIDQSLTHSTFNSEKNNSKYVFLGKYAFKGKMCEWVFKYIQGTGTQLQHYLGNISGQDYMIQLFDYFQLQKKIRYGLGCTPEQQKHVFVYGLLGCVFQKINDWQMKRLIYRFFIAPNDHYLPQTHHINDPWQKLLFLCKQQQLTKPRRLLLKNGNGNYICTIHIENVVSISHESKSYLYVQKKAIQKTLKSVVSQQADVWEQSETHLLALKIVTEKELEKRNANREQRVKMFEKKMAEKKATKLVQQAKEEKKRKLEDQKRRESKHLQKNKKIKKQSVYRDYTAEDLTNMSAGKRRRLEDLGILNK